MKKVIFFCSATRPSSEPELDTTEYEFHKRLLWHNTQLGAASVCRCGDGMDEPSVWDPVPGCQLWPVGGGGYFKIILHKVQLNYHIETPSKYALLVIIESCLLHHRSTLWKPPVALFMDFKQTSIMKFGFGAKCLVGKNSESLVIPCLSASLPKVNTSCNVYRLQWKKVLVFSVVHSTSRGCS